MTDKIDISKDKIGSQTEPVDQSRRKLIIKASYSAPTLVGLGLLSSSSGVYAGPPSLPDTPSNEELPIPEPE